MVVFYGVLHDVVKHRQRKLDTNKKVGEQFMKVRNHKLLLQLGILCV